MLCRWVQKGQEDIKVSEIWCKCKDSANLVDREKGLTITSPVNLDIHTMIIPGYSPQSIPFQIYCCSGVGGWYFIVGLLLSFLWQSVLVFDVKNNCHSMCRFWFSPRNWRCFWMMRDVHLGCVKFLRNHRQGWALWFQVVLWDYLPESIAKKSKKTAPDYSLFQLKFLYF